MRKYLLLLFIFVFSFSAINAKVSWDLYNGTLTISGGNMPDYEMSDYLEQMTSAPWNYRKGEIKKVVIEDDVTNVGNNAFAFCDNLISVEIPNSVTSIEDMAFRDCYALTSVTIPNSVTSIGKYAFWKCNALTSVEIPNSVTSFGCDAFGDCIGLHSVTIPNSVTSIGDFVFSGCTSLSSIEIPNSVTSIMKYAFQNCSALTSVTIPNSVTSIGELAFSGCLGLHSITFEGSTPPTFGKNVFKNVNESITIYVPANSIEAYKDALGGFGLSNIKQPPISLNANDSYTQDSQIDDIDVSFTRNFYGYWEALYLPFSLSYEDWEDDFEVARINAVRQYDTDDDGEIDETVLEFVKMKSGSVIYPNTPYLIKAKEAGEKTLFIENATVYEAENKSVECSTTTEMFIITGLYENLTLKQKAFGNYYVMDKGNLSKVTVQSKIGPYRWRMTRENRDSAYGINNNNSAKEISIRVVGEETTGIANIQHASPNTQIYDLNGRKVNENNLKPGMYVKNGRKVVVK